MNKYAIILGLLLIMVNVFAIDPNTPFVQPELMDSNGMGKLLVMEWAFGSIDAAFLILSLIVVVILIKYAVPISVIMMSIMGLATVFAFGFNSIFAWGLLIAGIVVLSLMITTNLLLKTQY